MGPNLVRLLCSPGGSRRGRRHKLKEVGMLGQKRFLKIGAALAAGLMCAAGARAATTISLVPESTCVHDGARTVIVDVDVAGSSSAVVGGQFFLHYDTSIL